MMSCTRHESHYWYCTCVKRQSWYVSLRTPPATPLLAKEPVCPLSGINTRGAMGGKVLLWLCLASQIWLFEASQETSDCYSAIFSFGDSLADTGSQQAAFPFSTAAEFPPYGMTYFHKPANRNSDGRLVIDFLAQGLNLPFLSPYLEGVLSNFQHGANFAASGAIACADKRYTGTPFNLDVQVNQFKSFKNKVVDAAQFSGSTTDPTIFEGPLYVVSIGGNDIKNQLVDLPTDEVIAFLPLLAQSVRTALLELYDAGARNFLVGNIPAQGCCPYVLTYFPGSPEDYDESGCLISVNNIISSYNNMLHDVVKDLRRQLPGSKLIYADNYQVNLDIVREPGKYGIKNTLQACCGGGGPYNFDGSLYCGKSKVVDGVETRYNVCSNPSEYVNWDGVHFTEAYYNVVAQGFLSGQYLEPPLPLQSCQAVNRRISSS